MHGTGEYGYDVCTCYVSGAKASHLEVLMAK